MYMLRKSRDYVYGMWQYEMLSMKTICVLPEEKNEARNH